MKIANSRLLKALRCEPVDRPPAWLMRQAGRYLPEYRRTRAKAGSFMDLCRNPELASEVAMQPLRRYPLDAAILFSDILTVPDAMGLELEFAAGEGPVFRRPLRSERDIVGLPHIDVGDELGYVYEVLRAMRVKIGNQLPIIGFSGSPWTLACYMLEGRGAREFATARRWLWQRPDLVEALLGRLVDVVTDYLAAQVAAGADVLMLFDTWGGLLDERHYLSHSLQPMSRIIARLEARHRVTAPVILFSKGCHTQIGDMTGSGCRGIGVDWRADIDRALEEAAGRVAVQGNLDPGALLAEPDRIVPVVQARFARAVKQPGYIFNLGHGLLPETNPETVAAALESVHALSA